MALSLSIDHSRKRLLSVATGDVSPIELLQHVQACVANGLGDYDHIFDFTRVLISFDKVESSRLGTSLYHLWKHAPAGRRVVAASQQLTFGVMRIVSAYTDDSSPLHVEYSLEAAELWLRTFPRTGDAAGGAS